MRYRFMFFAGLAVGFVIGARAGRERYEQLRKLARRAADSPAVQQAAGAAQAQAAELARTARDKAAQQVPRMTAKARSKVGGKPHDRAPGTGSGNGNGQRGSAGSANRTPGARGG
jgi:hypothetical protein